MPKSEITEIAEIVTHLKFLKKEIADMKEQNSLNAETLANIHQVTEDSSRKIDEMLNVTGLKHPVISNKNSQKTKSSRKKSNPSKAVKPKNTEKKKELHGNIYTYFKCKYKNNKDFILNIMNQKEIDALFKEHEKSLKNKKDDKMLTAQIKILYDAIRINKTNMKNLRAMKEKENFEHAKSQETEAVRDSSDGNSSDSESDHDE